MKFRFVKPCNTNEYAQLTHRELSWTYPLICFSGSVERYSFGGDIIVTVLH